MTQTALYRLVGGFCLAAVLFAGTVRAEPVKISASARDDFGRIVFNWPAPVPFTASISNRQLVVRFGRPVQSSFAGFPGAISEYIGSPSLQNGGRTVVFPLNGNYDLNYNQRGRTVTVDVVDLEPPPRAAGVCRR